MKMCAKLPLDGKNFKYVICNDGVVITGKLPITSELALLYICDLDMCGIICVKNLKFEQLLMRCGHLVNLFFPT
ncbi:MAG TPA: hypothetical protein PLG47_04665 [Candidatus Dojkabacteria bacterium]|nr:hypothetical protein [Candidatus Dojkabacteria bacterium]